MNVDFYIIKIVSHATFFDQMLQISQSPYLQQSNNLINKQEINLYQNPQQYTI